MESILKEIFLLSAEVLDVLGVTLSIIFIGFFPTYLTFFIVYWRRSSIRASFKLIMLLLAAAFSMVLSAIFFVSSMVLKMWG